MANAVDPVRDGFVASLARPGGNMTGLTNMSAELFAKRLEVLKEVVPKATRVAVLYDGTNPQNPRRFKELQAAAQALGVAHQPLEVRVAGDLESAFRAGSRDGAEALRLFGDALTNNNRKTIIDLAIKHRLPAIYPERVWVDAGGLMSYAPVLTDNYRRAAIYVAKILRGAKPVDLPVEQPIKFELVINLKAAEQIGLTIPREVLRWADEVIR
jgi:putative ABC transport system substrate-binding protein